MNQYVLKSFVSKYKATIGADFLTKEITIDDRKLTIQVWDTAGQERFKSLGVSYYRGSDAVMLVYDVSRRETFTNLEFWKDDFFLQAGIEPNKIDFPIVVLGNKIDLDAREVKTEEVEDWVRSLGSNVAYFECSAKDSKNVEQAFMYIAKKVAGKEIPEIDYSFTLEDVKPKNETTTGGCGC